MWIRWCDRVIDKYKALCWWKKGKWWQVICYISFSNKFNVHQVVIANLLISYTYISFLLSCVLKCILYWLSFSVIELNITVTFISWWWELYYTTIKIITISSPPKKKSYFLKGIDGRKCDFSRRIDFFLNFGMKCPEVSEEVKHGIPRDTRRSAGHPSDDFLGYPDDAL